MKILKTLLWFFVLALVAHGQEQNRIHITDTLATRLSIAQPQWEVSADTFLSPLSIKILYGDRADLLLQPHGVLDEPHPWMLQTKTDIMSPWNLELEDQERYNIWRSILGSIQLTGAAYLGYEYLKKHGFR
jgi:hypothetical protein